MASNVNYIGFPILTDAQDLMQRAFDYLKARNPGWQPSEGQLDVWMIEAIASEAADIGTLSTEVPKSIFRFFGATLMGIRPIDAAPATTTAHVTLIDSLGHTILAGTQMGIRNSLDELIPFQVLTSVDVPGGSNSTDVTLRAVLPGASGTNLGSVDGPVELMDIIEWIDEVTQNAVTAGGVDAETDDEYLQRLTIELQTITPRPIHADDFAKLALNVPGVQRATALDGYNPANDTSGNEKMVAVAALDAAGNPVGSSVKTDIDTYLQDLREVNFIVNVMDAVIVAIDVACTLTVLPDYNTGDVADRVKTAISNYLSPARWGIAPFDNPNDPKTFVNQPVIKYLELATLINNVTGVDSITTLTLGAHGGSLSAANYTMTGTIPLPNAPVANISITAT